MGYKVMFVDDEPEVAKLFKLVAEPLGCDVVALADGREAARRINKEKFDGVFLDAKLPGVDGFELARIVRTSPSNFAAPIAMLTGSDDVATMRKGFQSGVSFFLAKPLNQQRLVFLLRTMRGSLLREKRRYARLPLRIVVTFKLGERTVRTDAMNISENGMLLEKSFGAEVGQELSLDFALPQCTRALKIRAKVNRKEPSGSIAVEFQGLKLEDKEALQSFINIKIPE